jgi:uroporphyrinogen-III synthase
MVIAAPRIWITRALPGAEETAARLRAMGLPPLVDPLLAVVPLSPAIDLEGVAALAFTSVNGVEAFARLCADRSRSVFAVGDRTARAAKDAGFGEVASADGDVEALAALIVARSARIDGAVLHPSALEPAGDLISPLVAAGLTARRVAVYETVERDPDPATLAELGTMAVVLLHSPRAARKLARVLEAHPAPSLRALCLSPSVAGALGTAEQDGRLASVASAPHPTETALLELLTA